MATSITHVLELTGEIVVQSTSWKFVPKERFNSHNEEVRFNLLGKRFLDWFVLTEDADWITDRNQRILRCHRLVQTTKDEAIIAELGSDVIKLLVSLPEIYTLLRDHGWGTPGVLLSNGEANIFYVRDPTGTPRTIFTYCDAVGWCVGAHHIGATDKWEVGRQVFSCAPASEDW